MDEALVKLLSYLSFFCFLEGVVIAIVALSLDRRSEVHRATALAGIVYAHWAFCETFVFGATSREVILFFYHLSYCGTLFIIPVMAWLYLVMTGFSVRFRRVAVSLLTLLSLVELIGYFVWDAFYYRDFYPGPIGNVGIVGNHSFWSIVPAYIDNGIIAILIGSMIRIRNKTTSFRVRKQSEVIAVSMAVTVALYFFAWYLEDYWALPPTEVFVGGYVLAVNFYLIGKYRYLRKDTILLERQLRASLKDAVLLLDPHLTIVSANPAAGQLLGCQEQSLLNKLFSSYFANPVAIEDEWSLIKNQGKVQEGITNAIGDHSVLISLSPNYDQFGDIIGAIAIVSRLTKLDGATDQFGISAREKEIILMLSQGLGTKAIADSLFISPGTVKNHIFNIYKKTGAKNRLDLLGKIREGSPAD